MKGPIPADKISEIRDRTDLVALVSEYVTLKKAGRNYLGLCPFHQEKTPSFTVSPEKQMFYCFGCGEGGNGFDFLMKASHMTFPEAVRHLAAKTGVVIPEPVRSATEKARDGLREQAVRINGMAATHFARSLQASAGRVAWAYLENRGVGAETVKEFRLGYAPDAWRSLRDYLARSGAPLDLAEKLGLIIPGKDGGFYDRFRARLIFPIEDAAGRVVAFGGRIIGEGEPKYLNSPESLLFSKGRQLYGLNRAREEIRRQDCVILVEGYFDLIALHEAGIRNGVATLGTALTRDHVDLLRRYTRNVAAVFDPDEAGRKALARSLEVFLAGGMQARAVILPDGRDPDEFVRASGPEAFHEVIAHAPSAVDYYIDRMIGSQRSFEEKQAAIQAAVPFMARIADPVSRELFIRRVAERVGIDEGLLKKEVSRGVPASGAAVPVSAARKKSAPLDPLEWSLLQLMLEHPETVPEVSRSGILDCFLHEDLKRFGAYLVERGREGHGQTLSIQDLLTAWPEDPIRERVQRLYVTASPYDPGMVDKIRIDAVHRIRRRWFRERHRLLAETLRAAQDRGDQAGSEQLLRQKEGLLKEEQGVDIKRSKE